MTGTTTGSATMLSSASSHSHRRNLDTVAELGLPEACVGKGCCEDPLGPDGMYAKVDAPTPVSNLQLYK